MVEDEASKAEINALYTELDGRKKPPWQQRPAKELRALCDRAKQTPVAGDIFEGVSDQAQSRTLVNRLRVGVRLRLRDKGQG